MEIRRRRFNAWSEIAAEQGVTLTVEEVKGFLKQTDEDEAFDDIELDAVALLAIAGGIDMGGPEVWLEPVAPSLGGVLVECIACDEVHSRL